MEEVKLARLNSHKTLLMGILNVTPDSFSDGGQYYSLCAAVDQAKRMIREGADIIDIGGESTRPGADSVGPAEERNRIIPVISRIKPYAANHKVLISADTMHSCTAAAALNAGADIINDVSGFNAEPAMTELMARHNAPYILTHNRGTPRTMDSLTDYGSQTVTAAVIAQLHTVIGRLRSGGVRNIIVDPGFGFSKTREQDWDLLENLGGFIRHFKKLGYPVLIGTSRKRFLQAINPLRCNGERDLPTAFTTLKAAEKGAWAVRVHNVPVNRKAIEFCSMRKRRSSSHG